MKVGVRRLTVGGGPSTKEKMAGSAVLPAVETSLCLEFLPVSATVGSATVTSATVASATVTSATVTSATSATVETAAAGFAAMEATSASSGKAAVGIASASVTSASVGTVTIAPASPAAVAPASPAVPGAGTDKHSATKPLRTVVAVGCAGIRSISVVAVLTRRRPAYVARPDSDGNSYLRLRQGKRQRQDCQQR